MEHFDPSKAERVWQRVQGQAQKGLDPADLAALIIGEVGDSAVCLRLAKTLGGRGGTLLELAREDRAHAGCLRGICTVLTGKAPEISSPTTRQEPTQVILQRCYTHHLHRVREYTRYAEDPSFGPAFEKMAAEERNHCKLLLELLGSIPL